MEAGRVHRAKKDPFGFWWAPSHGTVGLGAAQSRAWPNFIHEDLERESGPECNLI